MTLPTSYTIPPHLLTVEDYAFDSGGFADVYSGEYKGLKVCVKRLRVATPRDIAVSYQHRHSPCAYSPMNQKLFCKEAVMWKSLKHPHILPLLGAIISPSQLISPFMSNGNLSKYIPKNPDANRLRLVGVDLLAPPMIARFSFQ
jgi:serine/threonine protein kinase